MWGSWDHLWLSMRNAMQSQRPQSPPQTAVMITDLHTPQWHLNPKGAQTTVSALPALLTDSTLGSQAILDGGSVLTMPLIHPRAWLLFHAVSSGLWTPSVFLFPVLRGWWRARMGTALPDPNNPHKGIQENSTHSGWTLKFQKVTHHSWDETCLQAFSWL